MSPAADVGFGGRATRLVLAAALVAACAAEPPLPGPPGPGGDGADTCGASGLGHLVGRDTSALAAMTFPAGALRVIAPGDAITEDYSAGRLNIDLGRDGRIRRLWCG